MLWFCRAIARYLARTKGNGVRATPRDWLKHFVKLNMVIIEEKASPTDCANASPK
jgi:hypothetical protein